MSEMVERVAKVIAHQWFDCVENRSEKQVQSLSQTHWHLFERQAKEIIEAMREPTHAMVQAARTSAPYDHDITETWPLMIDEALK